MSTHGKVKPRVRGPSPRFDVSILTVHLVQVQLAHVKYSNRRYFLHLMIQNLPPGLKQILNFFIGLGLKFFDAKEITIRQLHQNLLTPLPPKKGGSYMNL